MPVLSVELHFKISVTWEHLLEWIANAHPFLANAPLNHPPLQTTGYISNLKLSIPMSTLHNYCIHHWNTTKNRIAKKANPPMVRYHQSHWNPPAKTTHTNGEFVYPPRKSVDTTNSSWDIRLCSTKNGRLHRSVRFIIFQWNPVESRESTTPGGDKPTHPKWQQRNNNPVNLPHYFQQNLHGTGWRWDGLVSSRTRTKWTQQIRFRSSKLPFQQTKTPRLTLITPQLKCQFLWPSTNQSKDYKHKNWHPSLKIIWNL